MREVVGARIVEHRAVARGTRWLLLEAEGGLDEPHAPGDVVALYIPTLEGRWLRHPYTVSHADGARLGLLYRVIRGGRGTPTLAAMGEGDVVRLGGRFGESVARVVRDAPALVGVSTGTGVGPLLGWARGADRPAVLLTGFREAEDIPFADVLRALPNTTWLPTLSRPDAAWSGRAGRVTAHLDAVAAALRASGVEPARAHWHLVGHGGMVGEVREGLFAGGLDRDRVTTEVYHARDVVPGAEAVATVAAGVR